MGTILEDFRFALRQMRRSYGFACTVIFTMALGIGANAIVFGVINAVVLRPLALPRSSELVSLVDVAKTNTEGGRGLPFHSFPDYRDLRDRNRSFAGLAAYRFNLVGVDQAGTTAEQWTYSVSENYFDVLGVKPYLGRFFTAADAHGVASMPYLVLSYDYWRTHAHADPLIIGQLIRINKHPFTVLGVAGPRVFGTEIFIRPDMWMPALNEEQVDGDDFYTARATRGAFVVGRLRPGISQAAAIDDLNALAAQMAREHKEDDGLAFALCRPGLGADYVGRPARGFLAAVMALAGLVLVAACANLASLFSARATDRARELALRLALGSSRARLLRQLLVESVLVSLVGGSLGLAIGQALLHALSRWRPSADIPIQVNVDADPNVALLAVGLSIVCGIIFGLVPALSVWRANPYQIIKQGAELASRGRRISFRDALLLVQVVLCAVLVTSSLVAVRGMLRSIHASFGFDPDGVTLAGFDLKMAGYDQLHARQFQRRAAEAAAALPGVASASFAGTTPLSMNESYTSVWREGTTDRKPSNSVSKPAFNQIAPGYLATARTQLIAGRDFTWHDDAASPHVAIVNQTFARQVFGSTQVLGRRFLRNEERLEIVGVVENGKYENLVEDPRSAIFLPILQLPESATTLVVRSTRPTGSAAMAEALARMLKQMDPAMPVTVESWRQSFTLSNFPSVVATATLGTMGAFAVVLALTGVFGMASYAVSRRLRELGIRVALGANRQQLLRAAIGRPVRVLLLGSALGLVFGALASKLLGVIVYQATSRDPLVLTGVVLSMFLIGTMAAWFPARRALAIEPSQLLREE